MIRVNLKWLMLCWAAATSLALAVEPVALSDLPPARPPLGLPRISMPADRAEAWIRDAGVKYVRVTEAEFERLARSAVAERQAETYLRGLRLTAKFADDGALVGQAILDVHHVGGPPRFVPLAPCSLAIRDAEGALGGGARWTGSSPRPAVCGVGEDGRLGVLVEQTGELAFFWSLRGRGEHDLRQAAHEGEGATFRFDVPPATVRTLELELPTGLAPRLSIGTVERLADVVERLGDKERLGDMPVKIPPATSHRWLCRLPGAATFEVALADAGAKPAPPDVTLRQSTSYRLWPHGIDVQVDLSLDVAGGPLHNLDLELAPSLTLLRAATGDEQRVHWSLVGSSESPRVRLHFPQPLLGSKQTVRLEASAPLRLDQAADLPTIRPRAATVQQGQDLWQEGQSTIWVEHSLSLQNISPLGARVSMGLTAESYERSPGAQTTLRLFTPEARINVLVGRQRERLEATLITALTLGPASLAGRTWADVACQEGECFDLWVDVSPRWSIDAVEASPSEALAEWEIQRGSDPRAGYALHLRLTAALAAEKSLRLTFAGRHIEAGNAVQGMLKWDDLQMLSVRTPRAGQRWLHLQTTPGVTARLGSGHGVRGWSLSDAPPLVRRLLERPQGAASPSLTFSVEGTAPQWEIVTERPRASLRAALEVHATAGRQSLREETVLTCTPDGGPVSEIDVRFSQRRTSPPRWAWQTTDGAVPLTATLVSPSEGEVWRVRLPYPTSAPFTLRAQRVTELSDRLAISLPFVRQADHQDGVVSVRSDAGLAAVVESRDLEAEWDRGPLAPDATRLGAWRFVPERDAAFQFAAISVVRDGAAWAPAGAVIPSAEIASEFRSAGDARHTAVFQIENDSLASAQLILPPDAEQIEIRLTHAASFVAPQDAQLVAQAADASAPLTIALRRGGQRIEVAYRTHSGRLGWLTTLETARPRWQSVDQDLPVLKWAWSIDSPEGYQLVAAPQWRRAMGEEASWTERFLGPWNQLASTAATGATSDLRTATLVGSATSPLRASFVYRPAILCASWGLFLTVAVAVWAFGPRSSRGMWLLATLGMAALMLAPIFLATMVQGALGGLLLGAAVRWATRRSLDSQAKEVAAPQRGSLLSTSALLSVAWLTIVSGHVDRRSQADEEAAWPIITPTGPTAAGDLFVPQAIWERWRQAQPQPLHQPSWLIERAEYVGRLAAPMAGAPPTLPITATYSIRTATSATRVRLDFGQPVGAFRPEEGILDGQTVRLTWDASGKMCTVTIHRPGVHILELSLLAAVRSDAAGWQWEHPLPPVANSQASLAFPGADVATADVVSASGQIVRNGRVLRATLGSVDRLTARWRDHAGDAQPVSVDVDELLWLRVKTGAVTLRAKWVFDVHRGQVRQFQLAADRRLRLNGEFHGSDGLKLRRSSEVLPAPRGVTTPQPFTLTLDTPRSGRFSVEAEFLVEDTHGVGRLRYPRVAIQDVKVDRRRLAVSVAPELEAEESGATKPRKSVGEFLTAWGDADSQPLLARDEADVGPNWSLAVRPRELLRAAQQSLRVDFGLGRVDLRFVAHITHTGGPCFQHTLLIPQDLKVEQIAVREAGQLREARWTTQPGAVRIFLREKAAGTQRIELTGHLQIPPAGNASAGHAPASHVTVPAIQVDQAVTTSAETRIDRQPTVQITKVNAAPLAPSKGQAEATAKAAPAVKMPPIGAPSAKSEKDPAEPRGEGRFLGAFATPPGSKLQVALQANHPRLHSPVLIMVVRKSAEQWLAEAWFDAFVTDLLDELTFTAPASLGEPEVLEPSGRAERQNLGEQHHWRFIPDQPLTGAVRVRLVWRLPAIAARQQSIPAIDVAATGVARFIALAQLPADEAGRWQFDDLLRVNVADAVASLTVAKVPAELTPRQRWQGLRNSLAEWELYRAPARSAVLRRISASQGVVRIPHAELQWHAVTAHAYFGLAAYEVASDAPGVVQVELPTGCQLVRGTWHTIPTDGSSSPDSRPAAAVLADDGAWQFNFGRQATPRRLVLEFAGTRPSPLHGRCELDAPRLVDLPVGETAWKVSLPRDWAIDAPADAGMTFVGDRREFRLTIPLVTDGSTSAPPRWAIHAGPSDSLAPRLLVLAAILLVGGLLVWRPRLSRAQDSPSLATFP